MTIPMNDEHRYEKTGTDVLIFRAAGLRVAIELAENSVDCLVLGKRKHGDAHTIWVAGGLTALYQRSSSRKDENTGDAASLAYEAGTALRDMVFVQFHPTGMVRPEEMSGRLVTETVRGRRARPGGPLRRAQGTPLGPRGDTPDGGGARAGSPKTRRSPVTHGRHRHGRDDEP